jgi:hypothetical protein
VLFSEHCPLLDGKLSMGMRLLYTSVTWCYISNTIAVPLSVLVPCIALVLGVYPLVLNRDFALASLLYFTAQTMVTSFCIDIRHLKPLWYCQVSCHLLWFTFTKALFNIILTKLRIKGKVVFKSTKKKGAQHPPPPLLLGCWGCCWAAAGLLLGFCWASAGLLLGFCWASAGLLLRCCAAGAAALLGCWAAGLLCSCSTARPAPP